MLVFVFDLFFLCLALPTIQHVIFEEGKEACSPHIKAVRQGFGMNSFMTEHTYYQAVFTFSRIVLTFRPDSNYQPLTKHKTM